MTHSEPCVEMLCRQNVKITLNTLHMNAKLPSSENLQCMTLRASFLLVLVIIWSDCFRSMTQDIFSFDVQSSMLDIHDSVLIQQQGWLLKKRKDQCGGKFLHSSSNSDLGSVFPATLNESANRFYIRCLPQRSTKCWLQKQKQWSVLWEKENSFIADGRLKM